VWESPSQQLTKLPSASATIGAVVLPVVLGYILIAADMRPDLSERKPSAILYSGGETLVGWPQLSSGSALPPGPVRMLGYMMDGYSPVPKGSPAREFILQPGAGHFLRPAHHLREAMIEVRLAGGTTVPFVNRDLIWISGLLQKGTAPGTESAAWLISDAYVERASSSDITRWFDR
jgi:hypothetical protein